MIKVWSTYPPALWTNPLTGATQLAAGTIKTLEVDGDQLDPRTPVPAELDLGWFVWQAPKRRTPAKPITKRVKGSKGTMYTLTRMPNGKWSCECMGYQYRRFCKHTGAK